jgi:hypothetical protein
MKSFILVSLVVLLLAVASMAALAPAERDVSRLRPDHAKVLLALLQRRVEKEPTSAAHTIRSFFEPAPQDHCCLVWDNLKCAEAIWSCVDTCEKGLQACTTCLGPMWESCCCCLDNAGIHGLPCPSCCA